MRISRKLILLAMPAALVAASISVTGASAKAPASKAASTVTRTMAPAAPSVDAPETGTVAEPATVAEPTTPEPAGAAAANASVGGGHTDEAAGATTESNVDHQFNGQE